MLVNSQIGKLYFYNGGYVKAIQHTVKCLSQQKLSTIQSGLAKAMPNLEGSG